MNSSVDDSPAPLILQDTSKGKGVFAGKKFRSGDTVFAAHGDIYYTFADLPTPTAKGKKIAPYR